MAKATKRELERYDGKPVRSAALLVAGVNAAIAQAMETEGRLLRSGERLVLVLEVEVGSIRYDPREDHASWARVHNSTARIGTFSTGPEARDLLDEQAVRNQAARDDKAGRQTLSPAATAEAQTLADHLAGKHKRARKDCPTCQAAKAPAAAKRVGAAKRA